MSAKVHRAPTAPQILAAIAISTVTILLVAALVFPLFAKARGGHFPPDCQRNLRMLGMAMIQYSQDYDECWPGTGGNWADQIRPYVKTPSIWTCPNDRQAKFEPVVSDPAYQSPLSYAMNGNLCGNSSGALTNASSTVLALDFNGGGASERNRSSMPQTETTIGDIPNVAWGSVRLGSSTHSMMRPWHDTGFYCLSSDGHVSLLSAPEVSAGIDNFSADGKQDTNQAAGTQLVGKVKRWTLTFSEI